MNSSQPRHDPIVAELHAIRERLAEQYHDDLRAYSQAAESRCRELGFRFAESPRHHKISEVEAPRETEEPA